MRVAEDHVVKLLLICLTSEIQSLLLLEGLKGF
jgi:hypothetical protein